MDNKLTVRFTIGTVDYWITIQCLNNPTINRWYRSAKEVYLNAPIISLSSQPNHHAEYKKNYQNVINDKYDELLAAIRDFKKIGVIWPDEEPTEFNYDQQWCNKVHRYFTTLTRYRRFKMDSDEVISENDPNIVEFHNLGHIVNSCIHQIEFYCVTQTRQKYRSASRFIIVNFQGSDNPNPSTVHKWYNFTPDDYQYHTWDGDCDVIFNNEILGKSIFCSFGDEDDPNYFDTSGHEGWFGGFLILSNDAISKIYASDDFNNWLKLHNVSKDSPDIRGNFPIGKVIATSDPDCRKLISAKNIINCSIIFHN
jgi:hypothetical protein